MSTTDRQPTVQLDFKFMWCAKHLEPFRADWPKGGALAMLNLFQASAADQRITAAAGGDVARLGPVLREHGPMCCFLPPEVTAAVVQASLQGRRWEPLEVWDDSVPPGGYVCAVCRVPVESEPCKRHNPQACQ